jgi:hypothetical protein
MGDVEDAEASHPETEVAVDEDTRIVRAAMQDCVTLRRHDRRGDGPVATPIPAGNSTHSRATSVYDLSMKEDVTVKEFSRSRSNGSGKSRENSENDADRGARLRNRATGLGARGGMNIAFLYIAEAYQCYHGAAIAIELASRPGMRIVSYYTDPDAPHHLERIRRAFAAAPMDYVQLERSPLTRLLQGVRWLGSFKELVLRDNRETLDRYDAIIAVENTVAAARTVGISRPNLIYSPHGFGDRAYSFVPRIAGFDFVLLAGPKTEARMLADGLIRPGRYALTGSIKLETGARLSRAEGPLFAQLRPTVFYNPHFQAELTSWHRYIEPMLRQFAAQDAYNLIAAPHVKLFRRRGRALRARWEARSTANILIDTGSERSVDTSYLAAADIYVGDVSSQVYEFLAEPRPCVFLNAHGVDWRADPNFSHWHLGDVVETPANLMTAIAAASARHALYRARQEAVAAAALGDRHPGAARRAADAIASFLAAHVG